MSSAHRLTAARRFVAVLLLPALALVACSDDTKTAGTTGPATETTVASSPDSSIPESTVVETTGVAPTEVEAELAGFTQVEAPADCMCGDGSEFHFWTRERDPAKVLFFFEGGGACFSPETCDPANPAYKTAIGHDETLSDLVEGIWDDSNAANPFRDWSVVFVPYCTGDVHIGNNTADYGNGITVEHKGYVNGVAALDTLAQTFPGAEHIVVSGESAGSVPDPLYAGLAADLFPDARITVLADGSGAYPDVPGINALIGGLWGTMNAVPDWPVNAGKTVESWSFPGLFIQAGAHAPRIVFARHDYAFDETQAFFSALAGIAADDLVQLIDKNEAQVEATGVNLLSYISPGDDHTILSKDELYSHEVNGVGLVDWITALLADPASVTDNHCTDCRTA